MSVVTTLVAWNTFVGIAPYIVETILNMGPAVLATASLSGAASYFGPEHFPSCIAYQQSRTNGDSIDDTRMMSYNSDLSECKQDSWVLYGASMFATASVCCWRCNRKKRARENSIDESKSEYPVPRSPVHSDSKKRQATGPQFVRNKLMDIAADNKCNNVKQLEQKLYNYDEGALAIFQSYMSVENKNRVEACRVFMSLYNEGLIFFGTIPPLNQTSTEPLQPDSVVVVPQPQGKFKIMKAESGNIVSTYSFDSIENAVKNIPATYKLTYKKTV